MLGLPQFLWRLLPANPILLRVVETASRKRRDLFIRCVYLGLLIGVVILALLGSGSGDIAGLGLAALARTSARIFQQMSYLQLGLVALLAPIFTAGAITQEKDSQTYDILLSTPLSNAQIVLGSLISRLFFVIALLVSGIPIFSVTQIFGGVAIRSITMSFLIAASTACICGSLAMAIATFKIGTRRTIFSFYLFIILYLIGGIFIDRLEAFRPHLIDPTSGLQTDELSQTSAITAINPFLALRTIFHDRDYTPPDLSLLPESLRGWPTGWMLSNPASFYVTLMLTLSLAMVLPSIALLRRVAQSTLTLRGWIGQKLHLSTGDKTRKPRVVWSNPIAWREAKTKASAASSTLLRYSFITLGVGSVVVLLVLNARQTPVDRYIDRGSYDANANTVTTFGKDGQTFVVDPTTVVRLNGDPVPDGLKLLDTKRSVTSSSFAFKNRKKVLTTLDLRDIPRSLESNQVRQVLLGSIILEFAAILLILTNAAASTVTREKEDGTLDLLLTTPITSRYYIWGKLRGLVSFVLPLVAVPVASICVFVIRDAIGLMLSPADPNFKWIVFPEAILCLPGMLIIVCAFAAILGMRMSLQFRTTVKAVMASVGVMLGVCGFLGWCGFLPLQSNGWNDSIAMLFAAFSPFTLIGTLIDPWSLNLKVFQSPDDQFGARASLVIGSIVATLVYAMVVWGMYKSMVKNFDMTIRKQSR